MEFRDTGKKDHYWVAARALISWLLCLLTFYFYDKAVAGGVETRQLGIIPYAVISIWFGWIFIHNRILLRKLAFAKRLLLYFLLLLTGLTLVAFIQQSIVFEARGIRNPLPGLILTISFYTFLGSLVFLAFEYIKQRRAFFEFSAIKKEMELQRLKSQLNPHFLFNALNNIYSYNLESNKYGNDLILKLAQLMRFIVETTEKESVPLRDEIQFIENYISFEKERLGERCTVNYHKNISVPDRPVPPLLLFPFVENAFKHGTDSIRHSDIAISIEDGDNELTLMVRNDIAVKKEDTTRTGINNIRRRLELLFPSKHRLNIQALENEYVVKLHVTF